MVRFVIIGIVIAVAFTLYALVDAAMTDGERARGVSKPVWVVLVVVLPVIGGILWFTIGKGAVPPPPAKAPDDDPRFSGTKMSSDEVDAHVRELEDRLRELDEEVFPGEQPGETGSSRPSPQGEADAPPRARPDAGQNGRSGSTENGRFEAGGGRAASGRSSADDEAGPAPDASDSGSKHEGDSELGDPRTDRS